MNEHCSANCLILMLRRHRRYLGVLDAADRRRCRAPTPTDGDLLRHRHRPHRRLAVVGLIAIVLATVNMVGGFVVIYLMLQMFTRLSACRAGPRKPEERNCWVIPPG